MVYLYRLPCDTKKPPERIGFILQAGAMRPDGLLFGCELLFLLMLTLRWQ